MKGRFTYLQQDGAEAHREAGATRRFEQSGSEDLNAPIEAKATAKMKAQSPDFTPTTARFAVASNA